MGVQEPYELWREQRAKVEVPDGFTERVMTSIHQTRRRAWWLLLRRVVTVAGRSRIARASVYSLAFAVWIMRVASLFAMFVPSQP